MLSRFFSKNKLTRGEFATQNRFFIFSDPDNKVLYDGLIVVKLFLLPHQESLFQNTYSKKFLCRNNPVTEVAVLCRS